ncbi:MAG: class I SAM-dependent methyltransferase [Lachnospiraceae bacterium]
MNNTTSITALLSAFGRAYHTEQEPSPIFADTKAKELMTEQEYQTIGNYILGGIDFFAPGKKDTFASREDALRYLVHTQIAPTPLARARFCEDALKTAMLTGTEQYVILGAGMDTFAFREPDFMKKYKVFEVDHPLTQADKKERIKRAGLELPEHLYFVPVDFSKDDLNEALRNAGFDPKKKTFFSWLGVSYYLSTEQIEAMLDSLAALSAEGSSLAFDYADEGLFTSDVKRVQNMIAMAAAGGEPMKSCFRYEDLERLLEKHRFLIYEQLTTQEIQTRYFIGRSRELTAFEHICYALAAKLL